MMRLSNRAWQWVGPQPSPSLQLHSAHYDPRPVEVSHGTRRRPLVRVLFASLDSWRGRNVTQMLESSLRCAFWGDRDSVWGQWSGVKVHGRYNVQGRAEVVARIDFQVFCPTLCTVQSPGEKKYD